ncbi:MAG: glycosyltransferase [Deltaproteobacteria bacterium]|nr:glycosyltransferase [Deltaproteobacteria bacterium]
MRRLRVALVTNGLGYGGAERIVLTLARGIVAAGHHVEVVATTRGGPIEDELLRSGAPVTVLGIRSSIDARIPFMLARHLDRMRAELVHSHLAVSDIAVSAAPIAIPRVSTVHNPGVGLGRLKKRVWHLSLLRFDRIFAVGTVVRRALPRWLNVTVDRPSLVGATEPLSRAEARALLGLSEDDRVVLAVGRLEKVKGFDLLAEARQRMRMKARVIVIGDGPERASLEGRGLELLGARGDAPALLAAADVLVCPSRSEGLPQVLIEAAWASCPVVATRVGGVPEVVEHGVTGLLVSPANAVELAGALDALVADPARSRSLGVSGRARLLSQGLTANAMVRRMQQAYEELAMLQS